jgi:hypothetical protein
MDSRRLVVWISAGILGFQGGTLVLYQIHSSVLSWLYLRRFGLELVSTASERSALAWSGWPRESGKRPCGPGWRRNSPPSSRGGCCRSMRPSPSAGVA